MSTASFAESRQRWGLGFTALGLLATTLAGCTPEAQQALQTAITQNLGDAQQALQAFVQDFLLQALAAFLL